MKELVLLFLFSFWGKLSHKAKYLAKVTKLVSGGAKIYYQFQSPCFKYFGSTSNFTVDVGFFFSM